MYGGRIQKSIGKMEGDEQNGMSPMVAGNYIAKVALKKSRKPLYAIGLGYKTICVLLKLLPERLANWIIMLLYSS